jgi:hypothetical protein
MNVLERLNHIANNTFGDPVLVSRQTVNDALAEIVGLRNDVQAAEKEAERLKSLDRDIICQRNAAIAALLKIREAAQAMDETARCGLEYPVDGERGTDD